MSAILLPMRCEAEALQARSISARGGAIVRRKLARLNAAEEKAWEHAFRYHLEDGRGSTSAANRAWRDLQREFPRLMKYEGAKP